MTQILTSIKLAIAGDLHGAWIQEDLSLLEKLSPDAVLFVGDLGEADLRIVKTICDLPLSKAVILGNHDRGLDRTGEILKIQMKILGDTHCPWSLRKWNKPKISVLGARPCSPGGGYFISPEVKGAFGSIPLEKSVEMIVKAAERAPDDEPLVILAHSGPTGLGSSADSICGRDWKSPSMDWGDKDLQLAIDQIRKRRVPELVVFGHMHHEMRGGNRFRTTFIKDHWGTSYLNAACVPRRGKDLDGNSICHFSWVEFLNGSLKLASHRWFHSDGSIAYEERLFEDKS